MKGTVRKLTDWSVWASDLRWKDYDFERGFLRVGGVPLELTEEEQDRVIRRYHEACTREGRAPRLGDKIFEQMESVNK